jgi:hypothetical protein
MRLKENQVRQICETILLSLRKKQLVQLKRPEADILAKMVEVFLADLKAEDAVNREAEKLLDQYAEKAGGAIDRQKMFQMIKKQLVKDKKMVL